MWMGGENQHGRLNGVVLQASGASWSDTEVLVTLVARAFVGAVGDDPRLPPFVRVLGLEGQPASKSVCVEVRRERGRSSCSLSLGKRGERREEGMRILPFGCPPRGRGRGGSEEGKAETGGKGRSEGADGVGGGDLRI